MHREIKFRGKPDWYWDSISIGEDYVKLYAGEAYKDGWVYGQLARNAYGMAWIIGHIVEWDEDYIYPGYWIPVDPETVGQYTGLKDKNGVEIFEGDIVRHMSIGRKSTYIVAWDVGSGAFYYKPTKGTGGHRMFVNGSGFAPYEVIGNIHDNPELLGVLGDE